MRISQVKLIYFSATGTTRKILEGIAAGTRVERIDHINLTLPNDALKTEQSFSDELVIIGAPVYGGRLPPEAVNRFKQMKADRAPAVLVVLYGNREFEDALVELKTLAIDLGFNPMAAGAFIGEHSFATKEFPIADGRPDSEDILKAMEFGEKIQKKLAELTPSDTPMDLEVPGNFPYEAAGARAMTVSPLTRQDTCSLCGTCSDVCPTAAISVNDCVETETQACIRCCACIKNCPDKARYFEDSMMEKITRWLYENCSVRKEPEFFGVDEI